MEVHTKHTDRLVCSDSESWQSASACCAVVLWKPKPEPVLTSSINCWRIRLFKRRPQCSQIFSSIRFLLVSSRIRVLWGFAQLFRNTVFDRSQLGLFLTLQADHRALSGKRCQTAIRKCVWHSVVLQCDSLCTSDFWVFVFPCVQYSRIIICTNVLTVKTAHFV